MTITYVIGNIFESPAQVLVNTVNTVGVMGKGIAKDFKDIYPEMFKKYQRLCEENLLTIGKLWLYKTPNKWILNFPTKTTWKKPSKIEFIEQGLENFSRTYVERGIVSIAFPQLGCGNGELDWEEQIRPLMEKYLKKLPIDIFIYLYKSGSISPEHKDIKTMTSWLRNEPENLSFIEVWEELKNIIGNGIQLSTLSDKTNFYVELMLEGDRGIFIIFDNNKHPLLYDDLMGLWDLIRNYGFALSTFLPASFVSVSEQLIALFSQLQYCKSVYISTNYNNLTHNIGLRLLPQVYNPNYKPHQLRELLLTIQE